MAQADCEIKGVMLALGVNLWNDYGESPEARARAAGLQDFYSETMRFDYPVWRDATERMRDKGMNMVLMDLAEGLFYPSHPELAVKGTWSVDRMRGELARLRGMGLEPVPKLNFSAAHDAWLKEYSHMVSTPDYYRVCADVIRDTVETFDRPRLLHLGYDEETVGHQKTYDFTVVRKGELWWKDFLWFVRQVESHGVRAWIWSDSIWRHKDEFLKRMPRSVLQSNWYYSGFDDVDPKSSDALYIKAYEWLEKGGFDQVPTGSTWDKRFPENMKATVKHCRALIPPERLKGFLMAPWTYSHEPHREATMKAIDVAAEAFG